MDITFKGLTTIQKTILHSILNNEATSYAINASRQSGKTYLLSRLVLAYGLTKQKQNILIVTPEYSHSKTIFDNIINMNNIDVVIKRKRSSSPYEIQLISGTTIKFRSADNPVSIRGTSNNLVLCDEFAYFKNGILDYEIKATMLAKQNSQLVVFSTPKGKENDFYNLCSEGIKKTKGYKYFKMHYSNNPMLNFDILEDAKLRMPINAFLQEYEAEFIDGSGDVFDNIDGVCILDLFEPFLDTQRYYAGIDFGRANDFTVITILNQKKEVVFVAKKNKDSFENITNWLSDILLIYKPVVYAEYNSLGDVLIELICKQYNRVHRFWTSADSKREIIESLKYDISTNQISLPSKNLYRDLYSELHTFDFKVVMGGKITYNAKNGFFDDHIMSLAIANKCFKDHNMGISIRQGLRGSILK
jgi:phage FluMu gp28-like protein